jgi:hypothetical protein
MKEVFIKPYGWIEVVKQDGHYSLVLFNNGSKFCFNTNGLEFREKNIQQKLF